MALNVTPGSGATVASDIVGGEHHQKLKVVYGVDGSVTPVSGTNPLPIREPVRGSALGKGGANSSSSTAQLVAANSSRNYIEVSNSGANGVWLSFGSAAVAGQGTYLPSKATGFWPTTAAVHMILEASGVAGAVGYTEW